WHPRQPGPVSTIGRMSPRASGTPSPLGDEPLPDGDEPEAVASEPAETAEADTAPAPSPRRRRRWKRILLLTGVVLVVLVGGGALAVGFYVHSVDTSVHRVDAFNDIPPSSRPSKVVPDAENMLILGSDSRDPNNTAGSRSDTIILAHIPKGQGSAQLVS